MRFVLIHSPVVGPSTWSLVARELKHRKQEINVPSLQGMATCEVPRWRHVVEVVRSELENSSDSVVLVGHSGAGPLLPTIGGGISSPIAAYVFFDAALPPVSGAYVIEEQFLVHLRSLASDGLLPPWSEWWGKDVMATLVPDISVRRMVEAELPRMPLGYFEEPIPVPESWDVVGVAYIRFSEAYAAQENEAQDRGYIVEQLPGEHLHMLVDPAAVADRILGVTEKV